MPLQPRESVASLGESVHGGIDPAEMKKLGIEPDEIIDFSVSTNPAGIPPGIPPKISANDLSSYPDSKSTGLRREIARKNGVSEDNVLVTAGSTELIRLAVTAYIKETDKVLIPEPSYGEYGLSCRIAGAEIISFVSGAENDFRPDTEVLAERIKTEKPEAVFLCNPNNPAGYYLRRDEFEKVLSAAEDSLVILDEAYISFVGGKWPSTGYVDKSNLLVVRSMTKDYALAGLRLGYAVANEEIIEVLGKVCPPWNVNVVAQKAGIVVLRNEEYLEKSRESAIREKNYLVGNFEKLGFECVPSDANYFLVKVGNAREMRNRLLEKKRILVRDCASFGLPEYIRVAPRSHSQNHRLITAVKELADDR